MAALNVLVRGTMINVKVCAHDTDDSLVMIKGLTPHNVIAFLAAIEAQPKSEMTVGGRYLMAAASRNEVADALPKLFNRVMRGDTALGISPPAAQQVIDDLDD